MRSSSNSPDLYGVLGLNPKDKKNITQQDIKTAYKKAALKWHPDKNNYKNNFSDGVEQFSKISDAYAILGDASKRAFYDRHGTTPAKPENSNREESEADKKVREAAIEHIINETYSAIKGGCGRFSKGLIFTIAFLSSILFIAASVVVSAGLPLIGIGSAIWNFKKWYNESFNFAPHQCLSNEPTPKTSKFKRILGAMAYALASILGITLISPFIAVFLMPSTCVLLIAFAKSKECKQLYKIAVIATDIMTERMLAAAVLKMMNAYKAAGKALSHLADILFQKNIATKKTISSTYSMLFTNGVPKDTAEGHSFQANVPLEKARKLIHKHAKNKNLVEELKLMRSMDFRP